LGGPMWAGPLYDKKFVQTLLKEVEACPPTTYSTKDRIKGLLTVISEVRLWAWGIWWSVNGCMTTEGLGECWKRMKGLLHIVISLREGLSLTYISPVIL